MPRKQRPDGAPDREGEEDGLASGVLSPDDMIMARELEAVGGLEPARDLERGDARRPATVQALDARLSVWGQASREAVERRVDALVRGAVLYVERVGRNAEVLRPMPIDPRMSLLSTETDVLVHVAASLLPEAVRQCCRLLWVDPEKLRARLTADLEAPLDGARAEIRRRQALYRRRARLWHNDVPRLNRLRDEIESLRVPRCGTRTAERIARGLLERHREDAAMDKAPPSEPVDHAKLRVRAGSIARWIDQLESQIDDDAT